MTIKTSQDTRKCRCITLSRDSVPTIDTCPRAGEPMIARLWKCMKRCMKRDVWKIGKY